LSHNGFSCSLKVPTREDGKEVDKAKEIFKREGATDISYTGEASVKAAT
jgi:hypothetical protein